jgi:hypothetical protein
VAETLPAGIPSGAAEAARDTLGGAVGAAEPLPDQLGAALIAGTSEAFTQGVHLAAATSAALMVATAILAAVLLRHARSHTLPEAVRARRHDADLMSKDEGLDAVAQTDCCRLADP